MGYIVFDGLDVANLSKVKIRTSSTNTSETNTYLDLPKGAKWLLKGVNSTSLRV